MMMMMMMMMIIIIIMPISTRPQAEILTLKQSKWLQRRFIR